MRLWLTVAIGALTPTLAVSLMLSFMVRLAGVVGALLISHLLAKRLISGLCHDRPVARALAIAS